MAISSEYPGLNVAVVVNGQRLEEYDDDEEPLPKTVTKYIEAQSGAEFAIETLFKPPFPTKYHVMARLYIDGKKTNKWCNRHDRHFGKAYLRGSVYSQQDGEHFQQNFCFAELDIVEEARGPTPNMTSLREALSAKGQITLTLHFVKSVKRSKPRARDSLRHEQFVALEDIPEKALKGDALSHQTVLPKPQKVNRREAVPTYNEYREVDKEPFATFNFKYRSRASLKALRLITVDETSPVPLEDRPEEELAPAELRELLRRFRGREAETRSEEQNIKVEQRVKREQEPEDADEVVFVETRTRKRPRVDSDVIVID